jgi:general stress protein 26
MNMAYKTLEDLASQIKKIDFCMLSTNDGSGRISTRPMSNNGDVEYDGDSWFFSYEDSRKISEIERNANVSLTFTAAPSLLGKPGIFIAVDGQTSLVRDKSAFEEHWVSGLDRWFPQGVETPGLVLIKVSASLLHYWDGEENGDVTLTGRSPFVMP